MQADGVHRGRRGGGDPILHGGGCAGRGGARSAGVSANRLAAQADATLILARVKPHSSFRGRYESGLIKMLAIALGKQKGAEICHTHGFGQLAERIVAVGQTVLARGNVVGGLAVVENARHQVHHLVLVPAAAIPEHEPALLELAGSSTRGCRSTNWTCW